MLDPAVAAEYLSDITGTHETEVCENGEGDVPRQYESCTKNPGHRQFIPFDSFNMEHLPSDYRTTALYDCIKSLGQMIVKIDAKYVSPDRPDDYPFAEKRGKRTVRYGTGRIDKLKRHKSTNSPSCPCSKCHSSGNASKDWLEVYVMTAKHVVFDDCEAKKTFCKLFYHNESSADVTLAGFGIEYEDSEKDRCQFKCATCDSDLINILENSMQQFNKSWDKAFLKYQYVNSAQKLICIVSHPHGHFKKISIGRVIKTKESKKRKIWTQFIYSTPTCPGSSGALAYVVGRNKNFFYQPIHSGSKESVNYSGWAF